MNWYPLRTIQLDSFELEGILRFYDITAEVAIIKHEELERADTGSVPVTGLRFSKFFRSPIDNCFCKLALKRSDSATQLSLEQKNFGSCTRLQETDPGQLFLVPHVL